MSRATISVAFCVLAAGCAQWPATPRLEQAGAPGYRLAEVTRPGQSDDLFVVLAMSGGGTRAAALGYGVLEELRRTEVMVNGDEAPPPRRSRRDLGGVGRHAARHLLRAARREDVRGVRGEGAVAQPRDRAGEAHRPESGELVPAALRHLRQVGHLRRALRRDGVRPRHLRRPEAGQRALRHHQRHRRHLRRALQLHAGLLRRDLRRSLEGDAGTRRCHLDGAAAAAHAHHAGKPRRDLRPEGAGLAGCRRGNARRIRDAGSRLASRARHAVLREPGSPLRSSLRRRSCRESGTERR